MSLLSKTPAVPAGTVTTSILASCEKWFRKLFSLKPLKVNGLAPFPAGTADIYPSDPIAVIREIIKTKMKVLLMNMQDHAAYITNLRVIELNSPRIRGVIAKWQEEKKTLSLSFYVDGQPTES